MFWNKVYKPSRCDASVIVCTTYPHARVASHVLEHDSLIHVRVIRIVCEQQTAEWAKEQGVCTL
jgi:hypothetical protein